jgi:DNA-binding transcriptional regulator YiaG
MGHREIDTSTTEGFREGMDVMDFSVARFALLVGAPESTVKSWKGGDKPVNPSAAIMLKWMINGYRPYNWHMTGPDLRAKREDMQLSQDELGQILDVEADTIVKWESDFRGPPGFIARAIEWLDSDVPPFDWAADYGAKDG